MVAMDLVGPLPISPRGFRYLLTIIDRFTRYVAAVPLRTVKTMDVIRALMTEWILRHGTPRAFLTDNGTQFRSVVMERLALELNVKQSFTTIYHPAGNGMIERFHRFLKQRLRIKADVDTLDFCKTGTWDDYVPAIVHSYNATVHTVTGYSPYFLLYGRHPRLSLEIVQPRNLSKEKQKQFVDYDEYLNDITMALGQARDRSFRGQYQRTQQRLRSTNKDRKTPNFEVGDIVMRRILGTKGNKKSLSTAWSGPYEVKAVENKGITLVLQNVKDTDERVRAHADHCRKVKSNVEKSEDDGSNEVKTNQSFQLFVFETSRTSSRTPNNSVVTSRTPNNRVGTSSFHTNGSKAMAMLPHDDDVQDDDIPQFDDSSDDDQNVDAQEEPVSFDKTLDMWHFPIPDTLRRVTRARSIVRDWIKTFLDEKGGGPTLGFAAMKLYLETSFKLAQVYYGLMELTERAFPELAGREMAVNVFDLKKRIKERLKQDPSLETELYGGKQLILETSNALSLVESLKPLTREGVRHHVGASAAKIKEWGKFQDRFKDRIRAPKLQKFVARKFQKFMEIVNDINVYGEREKYGLYLHQHFTFARSGTINSDETKVMILSAFRIWLREPFESKDTMPGNALPGLRGKPYRELIYELIVTILFWLEVADWREPFCLHHPGASTSFHEMLHPQTNRVIVNPQIMENFEKFRREHQSSTIQVENSYDARNGDGNVQLVAWQYYTITILMIRFRNLYKSLHRRAEAEGQLSTYNMYDDRYTFRGLSPLSEVVTYDDDDAKADELPVAVTSSTVAIDASDIFGLSNMAPVDTFNGNRSFRRLNDPYDLRSIRAARELAKKDNEVTRGATNEDISEENGSPRDDTNEQKNVDDDSRDDMKEPENASRVRPPVPAYTEQMLPDVEDTVERQQQVLDYWNQRRQEQQREQDDDAKDDRKTDESKNEIGGDLDVNGIPIGGYLCDCDVMLEQLKGQQAPIKFTCRCRNPNDWCTDFNKIRYNHADICHLCLKPIVHFHRKDDQTIVVCRDSRLQAVEELHDNIAFTCCSTTERLKVVHLGCLLDHTRSPQWVSGLDNDGNTYFECPMPTCSFRHFIKPFGYGVHPSYLFRLFGERKAIEFNTERQLGALEGQFSSRSDEVLVQQRNMFDAVMRRSREEFRTTQQQRQILDDQKEEILREDRRRQREQEDLIRAQREEDERQRRRRETQLQIERVAAERRRRERERKETAEKFEAHLAQRAADEDDDRKLQKRLRRRLGLRGFVPRLTTKDLLGPRHHNRWNQQRVVYSNHVLPENVGSVRPDFDTEDAMRQRMGSNTGTCTCSVNPRLDSLSNECLVMVMLCEAKRLVCRSIGEFENYFSNVVRPVIREDVQIIMRLRAEQLLCDKCPDPPILYFGPSGLDRARVPFWMQITEKSRDSFRPSSGSDDRIEPRWIEEDTLLTMTAETREDWSHCERKRVLMLDSRDDLPRSGYRSYADAAINNYDVGDDQGAFTRHRSPIDLTADSTHEELHVIDNSRRPVRTTNNPRQVNESRGYLYWSNPNAERDIAPGETKRLVITHWGHVLGTQEEVGLVVRCWRFYSWIDKNDHFHCKNVLYPDDWHTVDSQFNVNDYWLNGPLKYGPLKHLGNWDCPCCKMNCNNTRLLCSPDTLMAPSRTFVDRRRVSGCGYRRPYPLYNPWIGKRRRTVFGPRVDAGVQLQTLRRQGRYRYDQ